MTEFGKKKKLTIYSPSPSSFLWLLERQCRVLFVQATQNSKLIFYKLNPNKRTSMKTACFKCSQLKTSPALLEDFLPLACIALKLSHFSFTCPVFVIFPQSFTIATCLAAHPSPWIWPGHRSICLIFLGTSNFSLSLFRGDTLQDVYIYLTSPKPYV